MRPPRLTPANSPSHPVPPPVARDAVSPVTLGLGGSRKVEEGVLYAAETAVPWVE